MKESVSSFIDFESSSTSEINVDSIREAVKLYKMKSETMTSEINQDIVEKYRYRKTDKPNPDVKGKSDYADMLFNNM